MAFLGKARREDLVNLAVELGEEVPPAAKVAGLKKIIVGSEEYEEEFVRQMLETIMGDRIQREEHQKSIDKERLEREHEIKMRELDVQSRCDRGKGEISVPGEGLERANGTFMGYLNVMKGVVPEPPDRTEGWPFFFHHAERMFKLYEVPVQYQGKIMLHCLKGQVRGLSAILTDEDFDNYEKIKEITLKEYRITPLQHKRNLDSCSKKSNESYAQYVTRMEVALELYLKSREVDSLERLKELIVTDKVKDSLPSEVKSHVYLKESNGWLSGVDLAKEIDNFIMAAPRDHFSISAFGRKSNTRTEYRRQSEVPGEFPVENSGRVMRRENGGHVKLGNERPVPLMNKTIKCFKCQEEGHMKRFCPKIHIDTGDREQKSIQERERKGLNKVCVQISQAYAEGGTVPRGETESELSRVGLAIDQERFEGIIDSGAEITVLRKSVVPSEYLQSSGTIFLRPAIGPQVEAKLVSVPLSLWTEEDEINPYVKVHVAVVENLNEVALITPRVLGLLKEQKKKYLGDETQIVSSQKEIGAEKDVLVLEGRGLEETTTDPQSSSPTVKEGEEAITSIPIEPVANLPEDAAVEERDKDSNLPMSQTQKFRKDQSTCESLRGAFLEARQGKGDYWTESGILYHTGKVAGPKCSQLVVPHSRRMDILKLAHEALTGGHLGAKKTRDRIAMSFWWEGLMRDVKKFCGSCHECQLRRRTTVKERVPIEAVGRPELPFQVVNADIFGPVEPKS